MQNTAKPQICRLQDYTSDINVITCMSQLQENHMHTVRIGSNLPVGLARGSALSYHSVFNCERNGIGLRLTQINECEVLSHLSYCCEAHSQLRYGSEAN